MSTQPTNGRIIKQLLANRLGLAVCCFGNGRLTLIDARANTYRQSGAVEAIVKGTCYPHVAFADGVIACKDRDGRLVCFSVRRGSE